MNHKLDTDHEVFFYEQEFYVLSNFSAFEIEHDLYTFPTSEHLYHWLRFEGDEEAQDKVLHAGSAHAAYRYAQENKHRQRKDWDLVKINKMLFVLRLKVQQHEYVRQKLAETGFRELIEDSWRDPFWGWGPNKDGKNMLGKCWMVVRSELTS